MANAPSFIIVKNLNGNKHYQTKTNETEKLQTDANGFE